MAILEELSLDIFWRRSQNSRNLEFYPCEVNIMVLHSEKGIPKLHCFSS